MAVHDDGIGFGLTVQAAAAGAAAKHERGRQEHFDLLRIEHQNQISVGHVGVGQLKIVAA